VKRYRLKAVIDGAIQRIREQYLRLRKRTLCGSLRLKNIAAPAFETAVPKKYRDHPFAQSALVL